MANTITEVATVYTHKRETDKADTQSAVQKEKQAAAAAEKTVVIDKALINKLENLSQIVKRNIEFSIDEETGRDIVRVVDSNTGEVVRQIPSDEILHLISRVEEWQESISSGVLLDISV